MIIKPIAIKWLFISYVLLILLLVALPLNSAGDLNNITILQLRGDYFFHILMFLPWMFFQSTLKIKLLYWILLGALFASATEALQFLLPYRAYNINDLLANTLGVVIGFLLFILYRYIIKRHKTIKSNH